jgi:hypothetical protein
LTPLFGAKGPSHPKYLITTVPHPIILKIQGITTRPNKKTNKNVIGICCNICLQSIKKKTKTHTHGLKNHIKLKKHYIVVAEPIAQITKEILNHRTTTHIDKCTYSPNLVLT